MKTPVSSMIVFLVAVFMVSALIGASLWDSFVDGFRLMIEGNPSDTEKDRFVAASFWVLAPVAMVAVAIAITLDEKNDVKQ